jgi:hypothetical protein
MSLEERVIKRRDEGVFDELGCYLESDYAHNMENSISLASLAFDCAVWFTLLVCFRE